MKMASSRSGLRPFFSHRPLDAFSRTRFITFSCWKACKPEMWPWPIGLAMVPEYALGSYSGPEVRIEDPNPVAGDLNVMGRLSSLAIRPGEPPVFEERREPRPMPS